MPHAPCPSAMGEQPCTTPHPRTPPLRPLFAHAGTPNVTLASFGGCTWHVRQPPLSHHGSHRGPAPPPAARPGRLRRRSGPPLVRERTGLAHGAREHRGISPTTAPGAALRRPGRSGRGRSCGPAPSRGALSGGDAERPHGVPGGRGQYGGVAGPAGLAGVGHPGARPTGDRHGRRDAGTASAGARGERTRGGAVGAAFGARRRRILALPGRPEPGALQGAAVWLRPPEPGCEVEASLPTLSALGAMGAPPISYAS